jgi:membrane associated rhomboid family serine protease
MSAYQPRSAFGGIPIIVKNLLIINGLFFLATVALEPNINLGRILGAFYWDSPDFRPWQIITHMFMHGGFMHIFFNMFALWMFGSAIEQVWGPKRFLVYYLITGLGAFLLHYAVIGFQANQLINELGPEAVELVKSRSWQEWQSYGGKMDSRMVDLIYAYYIPVVGASGAVFGLLLAFGMMFPNTRLIMLFFPVPIKAKYFVMIFGAIELFSGFANRPGDNVAHFAHLGGMLFGYFLIRYWGKNKFRQN